MSKKEEQIQESIERVTEYLTGKAISFETVKEDVDVVLAELMLYRSGQHGTQNK